MISSCSIFKGTKGSIVNDKGGASGQGEYATATGSAAADDAAREEAYRRAASAQADSPTKGAAKADKNAPSKPSPRVIPRTYSGIQTEHVRYQGISTMAPGAELILPLWQITDFCYPHNGKVISRYGPRGRSFHSGVDIKTVPMDTIRVAMSGVVRMSKMYSGYGNVIVVNHDNGLETVYAHNTTNLVDVNDIVAAGDPIALSGRTGRATTEHLHFEVRVSGQAFNPDKFLDYDRQSLRSDTLFVRNRGGSIIASNSPIKGSVEVPDRPAITREPSSPDLGEDAPERPAAAPARPATTAQSRPAPQQAARTATPATAKYHTVVKGNTLYAIARTYGTSVSEICRLNGIKETKKLQLGERLRVK